MYNVLLEAAPQASTSTIIMYVLFYVVIIGGGLYFLMIKPQKKQQKAMEDMKNNMAVGDSIVTTSGFYGIILDIVDDTVIVEFGNNKNCRIPMKVEAIAEYEKANTEA